MKNDIHGFNLGDIVEVITPCIGGLNGYIYYSTKRKEYRVCFAEDQCGKWNNNSLWYCFGEGTIQKQGTIYEPGLWEALCAWRVSVPRTTTD